MATLRVISKMQTEIFYPVTMAVGVLVICVTYVEVSVVVRLVY